MVKWLLAHKKKFKKLKNSYNAYEMINDVNPYSIKDLKKIHGVMTYLIVDESGEYRKGNEGVFDGDKCIHICPPPKQISELMNQLFNWMKKCKNELHPLILSAVFHYEFVFIHPFKYENEPLVKNATYPQNAYKLGFSN